MRTVEFKKSFDKTYRRLDPKDQLKVNEVIQRFLDSLDIHEVPKGLGLKRLEGNLWEIRVDLSLRVGFRMNRDLIEFGFVGNHETVKRFLKNI